MQCVRSLAHFRRFLQSSPDDARADWRIRNCEFLSKQLGRLPGITPPFVPPGVRHVYHYWTGLIVPAITGIGRDLLMRALRAEGVPVIAYVSQANFYFIENGQMLISKPMHRRSIFQELDYYGKGHPFWYEDGTRPDYSNLSFPVQERIHEQEFSLGQKMLQAPNSLSEMRQIVDAFQKVFDNLDALGRADPSALMEEEMLNV